VIENLILLGGGNSEKREKPPMTAKDAGFAEPEISDDDIPF